MKRMAEQRGNHLISTPVVLDVGGKRFRTTLDTLKKLPQTRLGRLVTTRNEKGEQEVEFFYDRSPKMMDCILNLYRTGKLHLPSSLCGCTVAEELRFWEIPQELVSGCCWKTLESHQSDQEVMAELELFLPQPSCPQTFPKDRLSWRMKLLYTLEQPYFSTASMIWTVTFFIFVFISIISFILETLPSLRVATNQMQEELLLPNSLTLNQARATLPLKHFMADTVPPKWLLALRYLSFSFFLADFLLRLFSCPDKKWFFRQASNWLEILVALKTMLHVLMENVVLPNDKGDDMEQDRDATLFLYAFSGIRAFRVLYLARHFDALKIAILCMRSSFKQLLMLLSCCLSFVVIFGTAVYLAEVYSDLRTFSSIPEGMWWAIVTMTTVGYGDVVPASVAGKMIGGLCTLSGVVVMALPIAVIVGQFTAYTTNLASARRNKARAAFLKAHPQFDSYNHAGDSDYCGVKDDGGGSRNRCRSSTLELNKEDGAVQPAFFQCNQVDCVPSVRDAG